jgi:hypothetical protein
VCALFADSDFHGRFASGILTIPAHRNVIET